MNICRFAEFSFVKRTTTILFLFLSYIFDKVNKNQHREMRKMLCPQCKIAAMYVKNEAGDRRLVYVVEGGEVIPKNPEESLDGFDVSEVFCLGCSWHGNPKKLVRY